MNVDGAVLDEDALVRSPRTITSLDIGVIAGTILLWGLVMWLAARAAGVSVWRTPSWGRWDTGHYLRIAESGYAFERCDGIPNRGPEDWCGTSGWFPGYPYAMRTLGRLGPSHEVAGRALSLAAMVVAWCALWFGFLKRRPFVSGVLGMGIAAAFPASVYYGAIFPVSTMVAAVLLALVCVDRERWLLAGFAGAVAALVYPSGVLVGLIAFVPLTASSVGDARARVRAMLSVGVPIAAAYAAVLLNFQRATGHWDAWFKTTASYDLEPTLPTEMIARKIDYLRDDVIPGVIGIQTILVTVLIMAAVWIVVTRRRELTLGERGTAIAVCAFWLMPLTLGGDLSLYRAESLLLPIVILLSRLKTIMLVPILAVCVPVGYSMAKLFFDATLI